MKLLFDPTPADGGSPALDAISTQLPDTTQAATAAPTAAQPSTPSNPIAAAASDLLTGSKDDSNISKEVETDVTFDDIMKDFTLRKEGSEPEHSVGKSKVATVVPTTPAKSEPVAKVDPPKLDADILDIDKALTDDPAKLVKVDPVPAATTVQDEVDQHTKMFRDHFVAAKKVGRDVQEFAESRFKRLDKAEADAKKAREELIALQSKQADGADTLWNHNEGYVLNPRYRVADDIVRTADFESKYWQKQLTAIEQGQAFRPLLWDEGNKRYVVGDETQPTAEAKVQILTNMQTLAGSRSAAINELNSIKASHSVENKKIGDFVSAINDKFFGTYKDLPANSTLAQVKSKFDAQIPAQLRSNPLYVVVSNMALKIHEYRQQLATLTKGQAVQKVLQTERVLLEPNNKDLDPKGGSKAKLGFDDPDYDLMGDFEAAKRRS